MEKENFSKVNNPENSNDTDNEKSEIKFNGKKIEIKREENIFLKNKQKREDNNSNKTESKINQLRKQIEFYFSDENIINDKFLKKFFNKKENEDPGVPITIIENFNKIKSLLSDIKDISKRLDFIKSAINSSNFIKLNSKKNKILRIDSSIEKIDRDDIDERTVYVENLPSIIDHNLLKTIFSRCGEVMNVSIPKFEDKKPKGFGFVTFKVIFYFFNY